MPQNPILSWLFGKKAKTKPKPVEEKFEERMASVGAAADKIDLWIAATQSQAEFDGHRIERLFDRIDELTNDAAGKEARIATLETDLRRLREQAGFA